MREKVEIGDIVNSKIWMEKGLIIRSIKIVEGVGLIINGKIFDDAEYGDFKKIGITLTKHKEIVDRDYILISEIENRIKELNKKPTVQGDLFVKLIIKELTELINSQIKVIRNDR